MRRGYYAIPEIDPQAEIAVRIGGLLTCVSAAQRAGIWVAGDRHPHVYLRHEASRMRASRDPFTRLTSENREGCVLHWFRLVDRVNVTLDTVGPVNALAHIIRCQPEHLAIAALDSALYQRIVSEHDLDTVFAALPAKYRNYRKRVDSRAMSGIETLVRLMVLDAGFFCELQVFFAGIGTVDLVVEGCIVIETDGRLGHADAIGTARDYDRDVALAALSYIVLRFNYRQVMHSPEVVMDAVRGALRTSRLRH